MRALYAASARLGPGRRIGLFGGSFNPAHEGHRHVALQSLKLLALDEVWWLVSPQNPLKSAAGMAPLAERVAQARRMAAHPRIRVTDIETHLGTRYTVDTVAALLRHARGARLVWLMGADNLTQVSAWRSWTKLFQALPIAVCDRPTYSLKALASKAARRFWTHRLTPRRARILPTTRPPAWIFLHTRLRSESATHIRQGADSRS